MESKRERWIDIARGIAIILMVLGHSHIQELYYGIYSFHIPLFFVISGYLFKENTYSIKKDAKAFLIPYFGYCFLFLSLEMLLRFYGTHFLITEEWIERLLKYCVGIVYSVPSLDWMPKCTPLWFLTSLFVARILYKQLLRIKKFTPVIALLMFVVGYCCSYIHVPILRTMPWNINVSLCAVFYMYLGAIIREKKLIEKLPKFTFLLAIPIFLVLAYINGEVNLASELFGKNVVLMLVVSVGLSVAVLQLAYVLKTNILIEFFGRNSVWFMATNYFVNYTFLSIVGGKLGYRLDTGFICFLLNIILISIAVLLLKQVKKLFIMK